MPKFEFCLPTLGKNLPAGPEWLHEIEYDGYRMRVERDGDRVRLITRGAKRYPWIVESALKNRYKQFVIDGEAVILGVDGISDFNALHSGKHNCEVRLYSFDILALDGDDLRTLPLSMRNAHLERLLARRPDGIFISPFEQGEIGPDLFRAACNMGLEGLVSKRRDRPYRGGRSKHSHPAMERGERVVLIKCRQSGDQRPVSAFVLRIRLMHRSVHCPGKLRATIRFTIDYVPRMMRRKM